MRFKTIENLDKKYIIPTYNRLLVAFIKGKGVYLYDTCGKKYLDFISGLGVTNLGHCYSKITKAIKQQSTNLLHTSNLYYIHLQAKLAKELSKKSFKKSKVFFCNSGAEANEAAIKLARKYSKLKFGERRFEIITFENSFHGRTLATLAATSQVKYQKDFEPLPSGFKYVKFNDYEALIKAITSKTCAVMIEPIQGEGGINVAEKEYLKKVRKLCNEKNLLLICDEVQCGLGRTGKMFAYNHYHITPDILTLAKAIANGLPMGVMIAKEEIANSFTFGSHASTFGGNPFVCAVALITVETIEKLLKRVSLLGNYFIDKLEKLKRKYPRIKKIKGKGLMIGVELEDSGEKIVKELFKEGILINCVRKNILRFLPPFIIKEEHIDKLINVLDNILKRDVI